MTTHDRITLGGAVSLAALMVALFAWLRDDMRDSRERLARIETGLTAVQVEQTAQGRRLDSIESAQGAVQDELAAVRAEQIAQGKRLDGIESAQAALQAEQAVQSKRLDGIENAQAALQAEQAVQTKRLDGIENAQTALQAEQTAVRERLARIDGELSGLAKWLQGIFVFGAPRQNALRAPPADPGTDAPSR